MLLNTRLGNLLVKLPVVSLSIASLSLTPVFSATLVNPNPINTRETLTAQAVKCSVVDIRTGQLALRFTPNGRSRAGLDNGDTVALLRQGARPWVYVRVIRGPNSGVRGLEGWVNSNYLACDQGNTEFCNVVNINTGQLALRFTPNGRSRAGLNNNNVVTPLREGPSPWLYVRVIEGPNRSVNGLEGWVNRNYLACQ